MRNGWYSRVMGVQPRGGRGFSLMETVIAIFVITFAVMIPSLPHLMDGAKYSWPVIGELLGMLDTFEQMFPIVEPKK